MLDENIVRLAYKKLRRGKTKRPEIQYIDQNLDIMVEKIIIMLKNTKPEGCFVEDKSLAFNPIEKTPRYRFEHGKWREIYTAPIMEQWVHHIIVLLIEPIVMKSHYIYSCASIPKRGMHSGKKTVNKWFKNFKKTKYFAKADIRRYYPHLKLKNVFNWLKTIILDEWFMHVLELCYKGLKYIILGFYPSQWIANWYLQRLDYHIKQKLKISFYIRYADDIVLISSNKRKLHEALKAIKYFLLKLGLKLKRNYQVCRSYYVKDGKKIGRALDFMGFQFYRYATVLRKRILLSATRCARKIAKNAYKRKPINIRLVRRMLSYMGWFKHSDTYSCYLIWIKPIISIRRLKRIISKLSRRSNCDRVEKRKSISQATAVATGFY